MKATFSGKAFEGKLLPYNMDDLRRYCIENDGEEIFIELSPIGKTSEKMRLYAFIFGPLMGVAVRCYTEAGWAGMDKTKCRYMLQAEFCKEDIYNAKTGQVQTVYEDVGKMTKARLLKFAVDICYHLETTFGAEIPDSEAWKIKQRLGIDTRQVK